MKALQRKIQTEKEHRLYLVMAENFIKLAILTADDIWGVTPAETARFVHSFEEVVNGYGEIGIAEIDKELAERGIEVDIKK